MSIAERATAMLCTSHQHGLRQEHSLPCEAGSVIPYPAKTPPDFAADDFEVDFKGRGTEWDLTPLGRSQLGAPSTPQERERIGTLACIHLSITSAHFERNGWLVTQAGRFNLIVRTK